MVLQCNVAAHELLSTFFAQAHFPKSFAYGITLPANNPRSLAHLLGLHDDELKALLKALGWQKMRRNTLFISRDNITEFARQVGVDHDEMKFRLECVD
jgi:hypothetical protein